MTEAEQATTESWDSIEDDPVILLNGKDFTPPKSFEDLGLFVFFYSYH